MLDQDRTSILIDLETTISEIADNAAHPVHDVKHKKTFCVVDGFQQAIVVARKAHHGRK